VYARRYIRLRHYSLVGRWIRIRTINLDKVPLPKV
jgi:hypothetical protein